MTTEAASAFVPAGSLEQLPLAKGMAVDITSSRFLDGVSTGGTELVTILTDQVSDITATPPGYFETLVRGWQAGKDAQSGASEAATGSMVTHASRWADSLVQVAKSAASGTASWVQDNPELAAVGATTAALTAYGAYRYCKSVKNDQIVKSKLQDLETRMLELESERDSTQTQVNTIAKKCDETTQLVDDHGRRLAKLEMEFSYDELSGDEEQPAMARWPSPAGFNISPTG